MAEKLSSGRSTVHHHVDSIFAKLGVHSRIELQLLLLKVAKGGERPQDGSAMAESLKNGWITGENGAVKKNSFSSYTDESAFIFESLLAVVRPGLQHSEIDSREGLRKENLEEISRMACLGHCFRNGLRE